VNAGKKKAKVVKQCQPTSTMTTMDPGPENQFAMILGLQDAPVHLPFVKDKKFQV